MFSLVVQGWVLAAFIVLWLFFNIKVSVLMGLFNSEWRFLSHWVLRIALVKALDSVSMVDNVIVLFFYYFQFIEPPVIINK